MDLATTVALWRKSSNLAGMARTKTPQGDSLAEAIARAIRVEMTRLGITQEVLAERLGWTQRRVSYRLTADHAVDATELEAIAAALGVPVAQLLPTAEPAPGAAR